jgi:2-polyprenyl-3-methyl-5-hydroxy-6-metoxy-1,4-benzoquinol methylase
MATDAVAVDDGSVLRCPCAGCEFDVVFTYTSPPAGEVRFRFSGASIYRRELLQCSLCGHFVSRHTLNAGRFYAGEYADSTYGDEGLQPAFERITTLVPEKSDNAGRVARVLDFSVHHFGHNPGPRSVLDVGSGLCVFLHRMKAAGWRGVALDPDPRAVAHARDVVGVEAICGSFMSTEVSGQFDVLTFNKVLEHVEDPVSMLALAARNVKPDGFVYAEVPDGEMAILDSHDREEFFIEHLHVFSLASFVLLAVRAGFRVATVERLREPSGKYTLRAFLIPSASAGTGIGEERHVGH